MRTMKKQVAAPLMALFIAGLLGLGNYGVNPKLQQPQSPTPTVQEEQETGTCISVYDGDTLTVKLAQAPQKVIKVRLIGIDTPELEKGEFGETARDYTRSLLLGQKVSLVYDWDHFDKYGRTLAYVYLRDGTFINARLLEEGYARVMTIAPNTAHASEFNQLQAEAKEKK